MSVVFCCKEFNDYDLGDGRSPLRKKFNEIIKNLEENKCTSLGDIKLISGNRGIKYFRAKLSDKDRLLFTITKYNNKDVFVILEVILNHKYDKSRFLTNKEKIKSIEIIDQNSREVSDNANTVEIGDALQARWLGKLLTFSAKQEDIVESAGKCKLPLVISGTAGSGKTSVALESLKKIKEKFKEGKILYVTKSENLIKESKRLFECEYYDKTTGKLETRVPKEIEFLSIHEFFGKLTEDVKGKKPISRNKFFSWFNEICKKDKFKKNKKNGDKIFEEFTAVIGGGGLLGKGGRDQYAKLGNRQSVFPKDERDNIYNFFKEYREFIEKDPEYYDPNLIAHRCNKKEIRTYDAVIVDEVQDLTESTLGLILKSLKGKSKSNFLLCGDVNQVIHPSFFSLSKLQSFLRQNKYVWNKGLKVFYTLEKNYRNSRQVIELANRILHLKNYCFASEDKMKADGEEAFFIKSDSENTGNVSFIAENKEQEIARRVPKSINWAVLILDDESKENARKLFDTPLVFNIHEAKGLEFENVILYKFMSHKAYNEIWNIVCPDKGKGKIENAISEVRGLYNKKDVNTSRTKDKENKSFEECKFGINALYVAVTRAIGRVYIMDDEEKCNLLKVIKPKRTDNVDIEDIRKEESSPEEWRDMALSLIDNGNIEQAKYIAKEKLLNKEEYVQEIINALKDKGYNISKINKELQEKQSQELEKLKCQQSKQEIEKQESSSNELNPSQSLGERTGAIPKRRNNEKIKERTVASKENNAKRKEENHKSFEIEEKHTNVREKEMKALDKAIKANIHKSVKDLINSIEPGELIAFKNEKIKEIYQKYYLEMLIGKVILDILRPNFEKVHKAYDEESNEFRQKWEILPEEERKVRCDSMRAKKRKIDNFIECEKNMKSMKSFMEQNIVQIENLLDQKQVDRNKKYRFNLSVKSLQNKLQSFQQNLQQNLEEILKEAFTSNCSNEKLYKCLSEVTNLLQDAKTELKEHIHQEEQKILQEEEQKEKQEVQREYRREAIKEVSKTFQESGYYQSLQSAPCYFNAVNDLLEGVNMLPNVIKELNIPQEFITPWNEVISRAKCAKKALKALLRQSSRDASNIPVFERKFKDFRGDCKKLSELVLPLPSLLFQENLSQSPPDLSELNRFIDEIRIAGNSCNELFVPKQYSFDSFLDEINVQSHSTSKQSSPSQVP